MPRNSCTGGSSVHGTHQLEFLVPRQIAEMQRAEFAERDVAPDRHRVFGVVVDRLEVGAIGIAPRRRQASGVLSTVSPADATIRQSTPLSGMLSPGFATVCLRLRVEPGIDVLAGTRSAAGARLHVRPVVDEFA